MNGRWQKLPTGRLRRPHPRDHQTCHAHCSLLQSVSITSSRSNKSTVANYSPLHFSRSCCWVIFQNFLFINIHTKRKVSRREKKNSPSQRFHYSEQCCIQATYRTSFRCKQHQKDIIQDHNRYNNRLQKGKKHIHTSERGLER